MLEIRSASAVPQLAAVLLVRSPVPFDGESLPTFSAAEGLRAVLALVVSLESSEVFEWFRSRVVDVVLAALGTAVAWQPQHCRWLCSFERVWSFSVLGSMSPHMHL